MAAVSVAGICNEALGHIGVKEQIASLDDPSTAAAACKLSYPMVLGELLERHRYAFAEKRQLLNVITDDEEIGGWKFKYQLPSDLVMPRLLWLGETPHSLDAVGVYKEHWDPTGTVLLSNVAQAELEYTAFITQTVRFTQQFVQAFALHLAVRLARRLADDPGGRTVLLMREAELAESRAAAANLNNARREGPTYKDMNPYLRKR